MFPHDRQNLVIKKSLKFPRDVNIVMNLTTIPNNIFLPTKQSESVDQSLDDWLHFQQNFIYIQFHWQRKRRTLKIKGVFWRSKEAMELHSFWNLYFIITIIILIKYLFKRLQSKRLSNCYNIFKNYVFNFLKHTAIRHELNNLTTVTSGEITM